MNMKYFSLFFLLILGISTISPIIMINAVSAPTIVDYVYTADPSEATTHEYQRKTFYSAGRFWIFYCNGYDIGYKSSSDGLTWGAYTSVTRAGNTDPGNVTFGQHFSLFYNGTVVVYATGASHQITLFGGVNDGFYRMGIPTAAGTITWLGAETSYTTDIDFNMAWKPSITIDDDGFVWIAADKTYQGPGYLGNDGSCWVTKNSKKDGTWSTATGFPIELNGGNAGDRGWNALVLPMDNGRAYVNYEVADGVATTWYGKYFDADGTILDYDIVTGASIETVGFGKSGVVIDDTIYLIKRPGGTNMRLWVRDPTTATWVVNSQPAPDATGPSIGMTYSQKHLFLVYGYGGKMYYKIYDVDADTWGIQTEFSTYGGINVPLGITCDYEGYYFSVIWNQQTLASPYPVEHFFLDPMDQTFRITNMDGSDSSGAGLDLLVVESVFYNFEYNVTSVFGEIEYMAVRFSDGIHDVEVAYNTTTNIQYIVEGNDYIILHEVDVIENATDTSVTWQIWLKSALYDKENMDIEVYFETTGGVTLGWYTYTDYADLYNLGGWVSSSVTGTATVTCTTATIQTTTITTSSNTFYTTSLTTSASTVTTTSVTSMITTTPLSAITTSITTTTGVSCETISITTSSSTSIKTTSPTTITTTTLTSHTTSTTVYTTSSTSSTAITTTKSTNSISIGDAGRITGGDILDIYANRNSGIKAQVAFRNLQNVHALITLYANSFSAWRDFASDAVPIEFGVDYWTGTEFVTGWSVKMDLIAATSTDAVVSLNWEVKWYYNNVLQKSQYINTFPISDSDASNNVASNSPTYTTIMLDLWYNKMNSSSVIGGRVITEYYALKSNAAWWLRWLTGNSWGIVTGATYGPQSQFFTALTNNAGTKISAKDIEMSYFWAKISQGNSAGTARYEIKDWSVMDFVIVDNMIGINTPAYIEPKVHTMAQGGFLNSLWASLQQTLTGLLTAIGGVFGSLGNMAFDFVDTILSYFGLSGAFRSFINIITDLWTNLLTMVLSFVDMTISLLGLIYAVFGFVFYGFTSFISIILSLFNLVIGILNGTGSVATGLGDIWSKLNLAVAFPLIIIVMLVQYFNGKDERHLSGGQYIREVYEDAQVFLGITMGMFEFVWNVLSNIVLRIIEFIRGMMPVV